MGENMFKSKQAQLAKCRDPAVHLHCGWTRAFGATCKWGCNTATARPFSNVRSPVRLNSGLSPTRSQASQKVGRRHPDASGKILPLILQKVP